MDFSEYNVHEYQGSKLVKHPKLSVCLISYNHEPYLETCLKNILNQRVNFDFEVIIGEDHSTDKTAEIVQNYVQKHPNLIKAFIRPKNIGSKLNFLHAFFECKGEYIIHIEGDDYWTDDKKLQRQVDFLDQNSNASACFHNATIVYEDGTNRAPLLINGPNQKKWISTIDFLGKKETWFMATASVMMRRKFVHPLPNWFIDSKSGDIPLYVILAEQGPLGYIDLNMSVYRKNSGGLSYTDSDKSEKFIDNRIFMYSKINEYTQFKFNHLIRQILYEYRLLKVHSDKSQKSFWHQLNCFMEAILTIKPANFKEFKQLLKDHIIPNHILITYLNLRKTLNDIFQRK